MISKIISMFKKTKEKKFKLPEPSKPLKVVKLKRYTKR